jgi:hypothetical protein
MIAITITIIMAIEMQIASTMTRQTSLISKIIKVALAL